MTRSRHKYPEFNVLPNIVWDALNRRGVTISDIGKSSLEGLPEQIAEADSVVWHSKKEIDEYVVRNTNLKMEDYKIGNGQNALYKAIVSEISTLRKNGYIQDWGNPKSRHGVWRLNSQKLQKYTAKSAKKEFKHGNFHASLAETTVYVRTKKDMFRKILINQYKKCLFCGFHLDDYMIAAHIVPYHIMRVEHPEDAMNPVDGLLLCRFCDVAFEYGSITLEPDYEITIGPELERVQDRPVRSWLENIGRKMKIEDDIQYKPSIQYVKEKKDLVCGR